MADQDNQQVREKETVVVDNARDNRGNNSGMIIGVIVAIVVVLLLIFVVNLGGDEASPDAGGTDVNVEAPAPTDDTGSN